MKKTILLFFAAVTFYSTCISQVTATLNIAQGTTVCDNQTLNFSVTITGCTLTYNVDWIVNGFIQNTCSNCTTWTTTLASGNPQVWCTVNCNPMGSDNSNLLSMTVNACSGIEEYENGMLVTLYPNPASGNIIIDAEKLRMLPAALSVFDISGRVINVTYEIKNHSVTLDTKQLEEGIYYYRIADKDSKKSATGKFIISR